MTFPIDVKNISFSHGKKAALKNVSFQLEQGKIYGLWGRNGAGKTTFMRCMTGLLRAETGSILINGEEPFENLSAVKQMCFIQENHPLNSLWTVKDVVRVASYFYPDWSKEKVEECLATFKLPDKTKVKAMSKGMKTALALSIGLSSNAPILIFDEPTNGLDAAVRELFYEMLIRESNEGKRTIIVSTHYIQELQRYIEELIVLHDGKLILKESLEEIRQCSGYIHGNSQTLENIIGDPGVIEQKQLGSMVRLMIDLHQAENKELALKFDDKVDLQDYLLRLTDTKEGKELSHEGA